MEIWYGTSPPCEVVAVEKTYSMIKPDGVRNGHIGEIVNRFERAGLKIERMEMGMVTPGSNRVKTGW